MRLLQIIPRARNDTAHDTVDPRVVAAWVRITALNTRDTPFKNFDGFLNPYGKDNGANKGGRHPTPTAFRELRTELPDPDPA